MGSVEYEILYSLYIFCIDLLELIKIISSHSLVIRWPLFINAYCILKCVAKAAFQFCR